MVSVRAVLDLLACVIALLGAAPLFLYLDRPPQLLFLLALVAAFFIERKVVRPLSGFLPTAISGAFFIFYALQFSRDNLAQPAVNILVILLAVRLVCERAPRNYLQVCALSLFSLAASSLFSLSASFIVYLALLILCIAASLVLLTFFTVDRDASLTLGGLRRVVATAAAMLAASLPLMLLFFLVMPRPQFPLWDLRATAADKVAGFSDRVNPGASSQVRDLRTPVLRAEGERLPQARLYWRGIVLNTLRERAWVRTEVTERHNVGSGGGAPVRQTVFPEPSANNYLIVFDVPVSVSGPRLRQDPDLVFSRRRGGGGRIRYETVSSLTDSIRVSGEIDRGFYLRIPDGLSPRILSLGRRIAEQGGSDRERLSLLEDHFASTGFRYSMRDLPGSADPIDEFLFEKKAGNCEFFASSFALLLRVSGVPSRLVAGYYGGDYNDLGGYYLVTEDMAHVWVEVYLQGSGWVRRDPSSFAVNFAGARGRGSVGLYHRLRMLSDSFNYYWNLAVITYDLDKQIRVFNKANSAVRKLSLPFWEKEFSLSLSAAVLATAAWYFIRRRRRGSREERIVRRFIRRLGRKYPREPISPSTGLNELADRFDEPAVRKFVEVYSGAVYRDRRLTDGEIAMLNGLLKRI